jgi:hypothetical protein
VREGLREDLITLAEALRHLPGLHDQKTHGRRKIGPRPKPKPGTVADLRDRARAAGIKPPKGARKADLAKALADREGRQGPEGPESARYPGRDRAEEIARGLAGAEVEYEGRRRTSYSTPFDVHMVQVGREQGFQHPPQVGTREEVDAAVAAGWTEVWRGVQAFNGTRDEHRRTAADINEDMRSGPYEPGRGQYGNGIYTSVRRMTAETYRGREPRGNHSEHGAGDFVEADLEGDAPPDSLLRIAIDPAARTVDYDDLIRERDEWMAANPELMSSDAARNVLSDPGRFAAARGYDAMVVRGRADGSYYPGWEDMEDYENTGPTAADQWVVFNRTVMMVQRAEDEP